MEWIDAGLCQKWQVQGPTLKEDFKSVFTFGARKKQMYELRCFANISFPPCQYIYSGPIQGWCNALLGDKGDEKETYGIDQEDEDDDVDNIS